MLTGEEKYKAIAKEMRSKDPSITEGKMMHAPALSYQDKIFAFFLKKTNGMVFKLGKPFSTEGFDYELIPFNPFKNKGPMLGWFELSEAHQEHWLDFSERALGIVTVG